MAEEEGEDQRDDNGGRDSNDLGDSDGVPDSEGDDEGDALGTVGDDIQCNAGCEWDCLQAGRLHQS